MRRPSLASGPTSPRGVPKADGKVCVGADAIASAPNVVSARCLPAFKKDTTLEETAFTDQPGPANTGRKPVSMTATTFKPGQSGNPAAEAVEEQDDAGSRGPARRRGRAKRSSLPKRVIWSLCGCASTGLLRVGKTAPCSLSYRPFQAPRTQPKQQRPGPIAATVSRPFANTKGPSR
jgi:hypothetical protein